MLLHSIRRPQSNYGREKTVVHKFRLCDALKAIKFWWNDRVFTADYNPVITGQIKGKGVAVPYPFQDNLP